MSQPKPRSVTAKESANLATVSCWRLAACGLHAGPDHAGRFFPTRNHEVALHVMNGSKSSSLVLWQYRLHQN